MNLRRDIRAPVPLDATLEHLRTKLDTNRTEPNTEHSRRVVLCCWECNQRRGANRVARLSKQELWQRSGRAPLSERQDLTEQDLCRLHRKGLIAK